MSEAFTRTSMLLGDEGMARLAEVLGSCQGI